MPALDLSRDVSWRPSFGAPRVSDADLVIEAQRGHAWAMEALLRRHLSRLNTISVAFIGSDADRDDLVQDCLLQVLQSIKSLKAPWAFRPWLAAIVGRTASMMFRRRRRRIRFADHEVAEVALENWPAQTASPEVLVDLRTLHTALEGLEGESRDALLLRRVEGLTLDEIAERMDLSVATVKRRLDAAKVFLGRIELKLNP